MVSRAHSAEREEVGLERVRWRPQDQRRYTRTIGRLLKVNVGVSQRPARDDVPAHTDRHDGPSGRELLVEHGLCNIWMEVTDVQGRQWIRRSAAVHVGWWPPLETSAMLKVWWRSLALNLENFTVIRTRKETLCFNHHIIQGPKHRDRGVASHFSQSNIYQELQVSWSSVLKMMLKQTQMEKLVTFQVDFKPVNHEKRDV